MIFVIFIINIEFPMNKFFLFLLILLCFTRVFGQNKMLMFSTDSLVQAISQLQSSKTSFYNKGIFPSQRGKHKVKEDDNIFFTTLITFTLQTARKNLSSKNRRLVDSVCENAIRNYTFYKNNKGINTYNFWQTNPPKFFPNSNFLSGHNYFNIPDDADCTSLIYLTDTSLGNQSEWLKNKLSNHANLTTSKIKSTYHKYRNYKAYSTWLGKKMPIEFDICVQTNILYFVFENKLEINDNDSATIALIKSMVLSGKYLRKSYFVSPSYKKPSIVLYHLSRLLGKFPVPELDDCKERIKSDIEKQLKKENDFMEKIILSTALMRMNGKPEPIIYPTNLEKEINKFVFFEADLFSPYARPSLKFISKSNAFAIPFRCKAYSLALLLEYELLSNK